MQNIYVSFAIRLKSEEDMASSAVRIGHVLGCHFTAEPTRGYPDEAVLVAEVLCLRLTLSEGRLADSKQRFFQLHGENTIEPRWDYSDELSLSRWMLGEFHKRDSPDGISQRKMN